MLSFFRKVIDKAFPSGPPHEPKEDGDYAKWRDATANNFEIIREDVINLKFIRDPSHTPVLDDLEIEFGRIKDNNLSESQRREILESDRFKRATNAQDDDLQTLLDKAGFNLTVYNNGPDGPAVDPAILLDQQFIMQAEGSTNYYAGNDLAFAGRTGGVLLVNEAIVEESFAFFGAGTMWAGNDNSAAGVIAGTKRVTINFPIPTNPDDWPFVFFVGGDATFNPDGSIATIEQGLVLSTQQKQLETLILKFKPIYTWCGLIVTFI